MPGYQLNGVCAENLGVAMSLFSAGFPRLTPDHSQILTALSSTSPSTLNYTVQSTPLTTGVQTTASISVVLPECDYDATGLSNYSGVGVLYVVALLILWSLGFMTGLKR